VAIVLPHVDELVVAVAIDIGREKRQTIDPLVACFHPQRNRIRDPQDLECLFAEAL
jgi:hypothetical protein